MHLGERDCSVQRRYQKVIEEAPAPRSTTPPATGFERRLSTLARAIGYRNLGTVEFVLDADSGDWFFLEINCRIQVEHPVTEAVTGRRPGRAAAADRRRRAARLLAGATCTSTATRSSAGSTRRT